jgi:transmembrane sensor
MVGGRMNRGQRYHSPEEAARALGELVRRESSTRADAAAEPDRERERLLGALSVIDSRAVQGPHWGRWLMVAVIALGIGGFEWVRRRNAPLTFSVDGIPQADGAMIGAGPDRPRNVRFSDGSRLEVRPGAHLRVETSSAHGSRLALVDGKANVQVVHREQGAWTVDAGPFEIHVTGTRFDADWDPVRTRLSVELYAGSLRVVGGPLQAPVRMHAGQRLEAGIGMDNWLLTSLNGPSSSVAAVLGTSQPSSAGSAPSNDADGSPSTVTSAQPRAATSSWSALLERADFDGIVREAEALGIDRCLSTCSPRDLRTLADAARYSGRTALAERCLLSLRKRAPAEATTSAFLLARIEEERGRPEAALDWYATSLKEAPNGVYAAEALAGKMRMLLMTGGGAEARSTAEIYLKRFPNGVAAATARKILTNVHSP